MIERVVEVKWRDWVNEAYEFFKENFGQIFIFYFLSLIINVVASGILSNIIPGLGFLINAPMMAGLFYMIFKKMKGGVIEFSDLFEGFKYYLPLIIASIVMTILISIGFILCIIPGLILSVWYMFTVPFIMEKKITKIEDFWTAMEVSRKAVSVDLWGFIVFLIILGLINIGGAICCGIGLLFTAPLTQCAICFAYKDIFGFSEDNAGGYPGSGSTIIPPPQNFYQENPPQNNYPQNRPDDWQNQYRAPQPPPPQNPYPGDDPNDPNRMQ